MKIGYGKLGRSMPLTLEKCGNLGGDVECAAVIGQLAERHPDDWFYLLGRNTGELATAVGLPPNILNPWMQWQSTLRQKMKRANLGGSAMTVQQHLILGEIMSELTENTFIDMDAHVWWVGQHGSTNSPIPTIKDRDTLTKPHDSYGFYAGYVFQGLNAWRDQDPFTKEEVYLNADARNRHKMRDLKWPLTRPVLAQYKFTNRIKHERYGDDDHFDEFAALHRVSVDSPDAVDQVWNSTVDNVYSRLEINGLVPGTPFGNLIRWNDDFDRPGHFGLFINEARSIGVQQARSRLYVMNHWVMPLQPYFVHGTWSDMSQRALQSEWSNPAIVPAPWSEYYPRLHSVRCTFTTPSSGSGWATAKPWEAFAAGTVCFFHPDYDDQDNILGDAPTELRTFLRVRNPALLRERVNEVNRDASLFKYLIALQRAHFDEAITERRYLKMIEDRIYG